MASNRKRSFDETEGWNVSEVREKEKAVVHGIIMQVSPVKTSRTNAQRKYFDGMIGDGTKMLRVVGFDPLCIMHERVHVIVYGCITACAWNRSCL